MGSILKITLSFPLPKMSLVDSVDPWLVDCRAGEDSKRLQALSEDEITELLTLQKYKAIDLHETTT